jgi:long-subunit acyl-CoA synthetase (AMP-forming)
MWAQGVMLTHSNILSAAIAISNRLPREDKSEVLLSYLPLAVFLPSSSALLSVFLTCTVFLCGVCAAYL